MDMRVRRLWLLALVFYSLPSAQETLTMRIMIGLALIMLTASIAIAQDRTIPQDATLISPEEAFEAKLIPRDSKVYISKFLFVPERKIQQGFETYVAAAMRDNEVPLIVVTDRDQADFEIFGAAYKKGGYTSIEIRPSRAT